MNELVKSALEIGYRAIDTAEHYGNEDLVGQAIKNSGHNRKEIFLATKIWNTDQGYEKTMEAFAKSQKKLGTYIDMILIHWPCPMNGLYYETWRALQDLYKEGRVKAIGVSNFKITHLEDLKKMGGEMPMVNQIEMHPYYIQEDMLKYCKDNEIQVEAWSPLLRGGDVINNEVINKIAFNHDKSPVQIVLRYLIQLGAVVLVKSSSEMHAKQNADIFKFALSEEEIQCIKKLNARQRTYQDPDDYYL